MSMMQRQLLRIAISVRDHLLDAHRRQWQHLDTRLSNLEPSLQRLCDIRRKLAKCDQRGWHGAARCLLDWIEVNGRDVSYFFQEFRQDRQRNSWDIPTLSDIYQNLQQTKTEFGGIRHDVKNDALSVRTEAIELEGLYLGAFDIQLKLDLLSEPQRHQAFRVVAIDPHPSGANENVTHPHVSDDQPCLGDAITPINAALADGRICDAFLLVRSVLTTYNPDSPFVAIEDWDGESCYGCGQITSNDSLCWCRVCEQDFCDECSTCCSCCYDVICFSCSDRCEACEETVCPGCLLECPECGRSICTSCHEDHHCPCYEERKDIHHEEENTIPKNPDNIIPNQTDAA